MEARYTVIDSELRSGVKRDYVPDPLDSSQAKTDTFEYWPYGESAGRTGTTATPFQFLGKYGYYRDGSDKTYVRSRYMNNTFMRWTTEDIIRGIDLLV